MVLKNVSSYHLSHYAMSSYETVVEKVKEEVYENFPNIKIDIVLLLNNSNILIYYL